MLFQRRGLSKGRIRFCSLQAECSDERMLQDIARVLPDAAMHAYRPSLLRYMHFQHHGVRREEPGWP